jgi:CIC family chloride channel protein
MKLLKFYEHIINWLHGKLDKQQFLIFSSMLVGLTAGLAAVMLKTFVHYIHLAITHNYHIPWQYYLYLFFPLAGIILTTWLVNRFLNGKLGRGTHNIHHAILRKSGFLPKDQIYSHIVTSAVTVGLGGSAGLEAPIVTTGAAIGSNYSRTYQIHYKERIVLLGCGAAAGISAAFNAPIAGVLFALEVLLTGVGVSAFIPLIIASAIGALCSKIILREDILLSFKLRQPFDYHNVPYYVLLGILAGLVSVYYSRTYLKVESYIARKKSKYKKALIGGIALALLVLFFPSLFGEGYESIKMLANIQPEKLLENSVLETFNQNKWFVLLFVGVASLMKVIAASVTISSGGNGGNFAPSLFVGAYLGFFFSYLINLMGIAEIPVSNFTIVAMAGILTGVFHAPLTGIFLIAEITGGYELMIPLMVVSALSLTIAKYYEPYSMDAKKLAKKGHTLSHSKDKTILSSLKISKIIETDFQKLLPDQTLKTLVEIVAHSRRNIFPVVDANNRLTGIILLDNIREIMFKTEMYEKVLVKELMIQPPAVIAPDENLNLVIKKFDETGAWNLPVVDNDQYVGFISKSGLLTKYRSQLIKTSVD